MPTYESKCTGVEVDGKNSLMKKILVTVRYSMLYFTVTFKSKPLLKHS